MDTAMGMTNIGRAIVACALAAAGFAFGSAGAPEPPYADSAFPLTERPAEVRRIGDAIEAAARRVAETDRIVDDSFAGIPEEDLLRIRLAKRRVPAPRRSRGAA